MYRARQHDVVLVLQGGGALGSYQGGVFEALAGESVALTAVGGISIGAINSARIAGNAPGERVARLREFWELVSSAFAHPAWKPDAYLHRLLNTLAATQALFFGVPGFFAPRMPPALLQPRGALGAATASVGLGMIAGFPAVGQTAVLASLDRMNQIQAMNGDCHA